MTFSRGAQRVTVPATRLDANRWQVAGTQLSAAGGWRIAVAMERKGLDRATYATAWTVVVAAAPAGDAPASLLAAPAPADHVCPRARARALLVVAALWLGRARLGIRRARTA